MPDARDLMGERSLDLDEARAILAEATDRESLVDALLDHAAQHFGYVALFAVHGDEASGVAARGPGLAGAPLRGLGFSLRGDGAFARAAREARVCRADPNGADLAAAETLRRPKVSHPRVFPLRLRSKIALLLWADDGERIPSEVAVTALESFLGECAAAFTRLILAKKRASRPAPGVETPSSLGPFPTLAPRRATIPSVEARAAALRSALLVGERRSASPPRRSQPPATRAPEARPTQPDPPKPPAAAADLHALLASFPGQHRVTRSASGARLPVASEQGPVLAAVVAHGPAALPGLLPILADPDPTRRYCALLCLAEVRHPSAIPHIASLLTDVDYPTRMAAIEVLRRYREMPEIAAVWPVLRATIRDARATVEARRAAAHAAGELRDSGAVSVLIATLSERDAALVAATRRALVELSRQDFGVDAPRWLAWWSEASSRHRAEWLIDALTHADATIRHEAAEELKALSGQVFGYYFNLPRKERERAQQRYRDWWQREGATTLAGRVHVDG
ncbi:MAG: HEAT repeat domain-containing protein [Polyangiales bacterium]